MRIMANLLVCPRCNSEKILKITIDEIRMRDMGEYISDDIVNNISVQYICMNCGLDLTDVELKRKDGE